MERNLRQPPIANSQPPTASSQPPTAFQGEIGAFSEEAVRALFPDAVPVPKPSFEAVFAAVAAGEEVQPLNRRADNKLKDNKF